MQGPNFYKGRICLNCLTNSLENGREILEATDGNAAVGLLSASYPDVAGAVEDMRRYQSKLDNNISVGLGGGNPSQWLAVAQISAVLKPRHINQTFTGGGYTRALCGDGPFMNSMVAPCGQVGMVKVSTGPQASKQPEGVVPVQTAIAMACEMGANSLKYFPMGGLKCRNEFEAVAHACAEADVGLEPTGGIDLGNFEEIVRIAVDAGVKHIIPHVYSSIVDSSTGATRVADVQSLYRIICSLV